MVDNNHTIIKIFCFSEFELLIIIKYDDKASNLTAYAPIQARDVGKEILTIRDVMSTIRGRKYGEES